MVLVELRQDFEVVFLLLQLRVLFSVLYQLRFQMVQVLFLFRVDQLQRLYLLRKLLVHFLVNQKATVDFVYHFRWGRNENYVRVFFEVGVFFR